MTGLLNDLDVVRSTEIVRANTDIHYIYQEWKLVNIRNGEGSRWEYSIVKDMSERDLRSSNWKDR